MDNEKYIYILVAASGIRKGHVMIWTQMGLNNLKKGIYLFISRVNLSNNIMSNNTIR